ncbi:MAG: hypothetical protein LRY27_00155 [Chitinophagales bacterium]|nr:hypothetical protein [Chitinophagales bacterium]
MKNILFISLAMVLISLSACKKDKQEPMLIFKYTFDENGERLNNFGNPATIPAGNAAQTPDFQKLGIHSIELINYVVSLPTENTVLYKGETKEVNGVSGIDFSAEKIVSEGEVLVKIPIKDITPGTYNYLRNSLGYQNYKINFLYADSTLGNLNLVGNIASFVGYRTYITNFDLAGQNIDVNDMKDQGYFAFHIASPFPFTQTGSSTFYYGF